jgi:DNA-binding response OmpR family regulator
VPASATTAEHSILLVEEYDALAVAIESALKKFAPRHRVHVARSLTEARTLALAHGPGLIILDFDPPHPGALAFFEQMRSSLPDTRVLVIAAGTPRDLPAERGAQGALQFLEKPFELIDFGAAVQALLGPWRETGTSRGTLRDLAFVDAIALGCLAGGNSVIQLQAGGDRSGQLHLQNGHIVHAATSEAEGERALVDMLCWNNGSFTEMPRVGVARHTIQHPWIPTLITALREARKRQPVAILPRTVEPESAPSKKTGPKILVIDDTEMLLIFVEDSLTMAQPDLQITTALTGLRGVKEAARLVPDLVLCDYDLPDIKGDEVCRRIGADEKTARVPIVMMSGHVHELTAAAVKLPNVVATVAKPFLSDAIVGLVQQRLKEGPLRPQTKAVQSDARPPEKKQAPAKLPPAEPPQVSEFLQPQIAVPISREDLSRSVAAKNLAPKPATGGSASAEANKFASSLATNEVLLDLPLDVVAMQMDSSFQIRSIRARPASPTVTIQLPALAARAALPMQTGFLLGCVELDAVGRISTVRLVPTQQPFRQIESRTAFAIGDITVLASDESERLQLMSVEASRMTMQLFAPLELLSVEFAANLEVRQLVLRCRGSAVRVTLNSQGSAAHTGAIFETTAVRLNDSKHIVELTLAPTS